MINPALLEKAKNKGTEDDYLAWLRTMPSALSGLYGDWKDGEGVNEAAHVRRVDSGAGTGIKPEYSAVPLMRSEHQLQHQKGEQIFAPKSWWEKAAIKHLVMWINNVQPKPPVKEKERTFLIQHAGQFLSLWLWAKQYFAGNNNGLLVTVRKVGKRTLKQNAGMWGAVYGDLVRYYKANPTNFMRDLVEAVMKEDINEDIVHKMHKTLHGYSSTANLNPEQHSEYFRLIAEYMIKKHNYEVKMPEKPEDYYNEV